MTTQVYRIDKPAEMRRAGSMDLVRMLPVPGGHSLFLPRWLLDAITYAIVGGEFIHLSGPTGTAKSSFLEALYREPRNFLSHCALLGYPEREIEMYTIEMATFESPGELYQRRALREGTTYDEPSPLIQALEEAAVARQDRYALIWLREMGRVHSASVQGGLLNLMYRGEIRRPDGSSIDGMGISWVADSNYQAENDSTHTLVVLDDALKRRLAVNLTMDYLSTDQEVQVLGHLVDEPGVLELTGEGKRNEGNDELIEVAVRLGHLVRKQRGQGNLQSIAPPTIYGYLTFIRMAMALPHLHVKHVAQMTLLGNASVEDRKVLGGVFSEVFGWQTGPGGDPAKGVGLI